MSQRLNQRQSRDFRLLLQEELVGRAKKNPSYSLRAFARSLEIQSGFLSKILKGQRRVTPATVRRLGPKLGLALKQIDQIANACGEPPKDLAFRQIAYDQFQVISEWYHFAILELANVHGFRTEPLWIARALGITQAEAQAAIDRLVRLEYVALGDNGKWTITEGHTTTLGTQDTSVALRAMQKQFLQAALAALDNVGVDRRDQSTMTMACDSSRLPRAKLMIQEFRRKLCGYLEAGDHRDSVYQLSISLFPATKEFTTKDSK